MLVDRPGKVRGMRQLEPAGQGQAVLFCFVPGDELPEAQVNAVQVLIPTLIGLWAILYGFIAAMSVDRYRDQVIGGIISGLGLWLVVLGIVTAIQ